MEQGAIGTYEHWTMSTSTEELVRPATPEETAAITFPDTGYLGVAASFAEAFSQQYESPKEFFYIDLLALIGALISGRVRAEFDLPCQPRLYVLKVAVSAWRRKTTSTVIADRFLRSVKALGPDESYVSGWPNYVLRCWQCGGFGQCAHRSAQ